MNHRNRRHLVLSVLLATVAPAASAQVLDDPRLFGETWWSGLARPTSLAFVAPGEALVIENLTGRVKHLVEGSPAAIALDLEVASQGGLGLELAPDFETSGHVFLYYARSTTGEGGGWAGSELWRYRWDGQALVDPLGPLFEVAFDPSQENLSMHNSGTLRVGPDGRIHGQVGDKFRGSESDPRIEQNTGSTSASGAGGIFRLDPDGTVPADNPFRTHADPLVHPWFVYGFRNSLGMAFDPVTGRLWFGENGSTNYDELNIAFPGMNSGWNRVMGPDDRDATYAENGDTAYDAVDLVQLPGSAYADPLFSWSDCIGITALEFLGRRFPEDLWYDLIVGDTNEGHLYHFELDADRTGLVLPPELADAVADGPGERDQLRIASGVGVTTDLRVGPDGYLYVVSHYAGTIYRVRPTTDLFDPEAVAVLEGKAGPKGLPALWSADGDALVVGPAGGPEPIATRSVELRFELNAARPDRLDVRLVARAERDPTTWRVSIHDVTTGAWTELHAGALATTFTALDLSDLADPGNYVDPADRSLRLRVESRSGSTAAPRPLGAGGGGAPARLHLDLARVEVRWP